jgi:hypothetical protein
MEILSSVSGQPLPRGENFVQGSSRRGGTLAGASGQTPKTIVARRWGLRSSVFGHLRFQFLHVSCRKSCQVPLQAPCPRGLLWCGVARGRQRQGRAAKGQEQFWRGARKYFLPSPGSRLPAEKVLCRAVRGVAERLQGQAAKRQKQLWHGIEDCVLSSSDICVSMFLHISCRKSCQVPLQASSPWGPF